MEPFEITTEDGIVYKVTPFLYKTKANYSVTIEDYVVVYTGNPNIGGAFLIPEEAPDHLDLHLLEEIGQLIESHVM